jgi:hypothetical protein
MAWSWRYPIWDASGDGPTLVPEDGRQQAADSRQIHIPGTRGTAAAGELEQKSLDVLGRDFAWHLACVAQEASGAAGEGADGVGHKPAQRHVPFHSLDGILDLAGLEHG